MTPTPSVDLAPYTTFGIHAVAEYFVSVTTVDKLLEAISWARTRGASYHILGGGSNVLLSGDVQGLVIHIRLQERSASVEGDVVTVRCGAGENWHQVVTWTVERGWAGLENLALIPGTVGAAPMQNIGAYGVEQSACFHELDAMNADNGEIKTFTKDECKFGYRESIFKRELRDKYVITSVTYRLSTVPTIRASYKDVSEELAVRGITQPTIMDVYSSVVAIRTRKLPDPKVIGNAGSFFKNPVVSAQKATTLHESHPLLPVYPQADGSSKLAAAWLIDQCGWKGVREGDAGVHANQALVLVNHGSAEGAQIIDLATRIQQSVFDRFGVELEREVNVW